MTYLSPSSPVFTFSKSPPANTAKAVANHPALFIPRVATRGYGDVTPMGSRAQRCTDAKDVLSLFPEDGVSHLRSSERSIMIKKTCHREK